MSEFVKFRDAVNAQIAAITKHQVLRSKAPYPDMWATYLSSFPEGTNPIFRVRTEHDCACCRHFIRDVGGMLAVVDGKLVSIWDINVGGTFQVVADALSALVKSAGIDVQYMHYQANIGAASSKEYSEMGDLVATWNHLFTTLPTNLVVRKDSVAELTGQYRTNKQVLERSLLELTDEAVNIVLDLIDQNSLYRGAEHRTTVETLKRVKAEYKNAPDKDIYLWAASTRLSKSGGFRNTVIGTLLQDISEGVDLEVAVRKFEDKVAPQNYKRPTALITKSMIASAQQKVAELGIEPSLHRRYATIDDITINNVLFASNSAKADMGVFDQLVNATSDTLPNLDKVAEITIEDFLQNVLPKADKIEIFFENKHCTNLVSLIAPEYPDALPIFKWDNNFSWSYNGNVADSIKERVKQAGGKVDGVLRGSLSWFNYDDLDLSIEEPNGNIIDFRNKRGHKSTGCLDVDQNAGSGTTRTPVENIAYSDKSKMQHGDYKFKITQFSKREDKDVGFEFELEFDNGEIFTFSHPKALAHKQVVQVASFNLSKDGFKILGPTGSSKTISKDHWGISTGKFHPVTTIMNSPNHWDGHQTGNRHVFFMLEGCVNPETSRGFYNEFLRNELNEHRKVFEVLGAQLKTIESDQQLSGLGFSTTKPDTVVCRVSGSFNRIIKIKF